MFKCDDCEREFSKKSKLNRHVRETHMNIKEHICSECGKDFKRKSHLKRHMISHSENPKPHVCKFEGCYMSFTCKHHLERHFKIIHTEDYSHSCPYCPSKFSKKFSLHKHLSSQHGERAPLMCSVCQKTFFKSGQLEAHFITHDTLIPKQMDYQEIMEIPNNSHPKDPQMHQDHHKNTSKVAESQTKQDEIREKNGLDTPKNSLPTNEFQDLIGNNSSPQLKKKKKIFQPVYHENEDFSLSGNLSGKQTNQPTGTGIVDMTPMKLQQFDYMNFNMNPNSHLHILNDIHSQTMTGGQEYLKYKSPSLKPAITGRKLSEIFILPEFKEHKNSFNSSDYGNLTIFKDLFQESSGANSRRASLSVNNIRKGSLFHLNGKLEEDDDSNCPHLADLHSNHITDSFNLDPTNIQSIPPIHLNPQDSDLTNIHHNFTNLHQQDHPIQINHHMIFNQNTHHIHLEHPHTAIHNEQSQLHDNLHKQKYIINPERQSNSIAVNTNNDLNTHPNEYMIKSEDHTHSNNKTSCNHKQKEEKCYKCNYPECDKFYTKLSNLKTHIRTFHFKSKDFKCNFSGCKSAYLHKKSLKEHIERVHQQQVSPGRHSDEFDNSEEQQPQNLDYKSLYKEEERLQEFPLQQQQKLTGNQSIYAHNTSSHLPAQQNDVYGIYISTPINYHHHFTQLRHPEHIHPQQQNYEYQLKQEDELSYHLQTTQMSYGQQQIHVHSQNQKQIHIEPLNTYPQQ